MPGYNSDEFQFALGPGAIWQAHSPVWRQTVKLNYFRVVDNPLGTAANSQNPFPTTFLRQKS
jgi:hypothetical protein